MTDGFREKRWWKTPTQIAITSKSQASADELKEEFNIAEGYSSNIIMRAAELAAESEEFKTLHAKALRKEKEKEGATGGQKGMKSA